MAETRRRKKLNQKERQLVYQKCNGHCAYCGCELEYKDMQVDHVTSFYRNGEDNLSNYLPACRSCNHYKSTFTVEQFRDRIQTLPERMKRDSVNFKNLLRFGKISVNDKPVKFYFENIEKGCELRADVTTNKTTKGI